MPEPSDWPADMPSADPPRPAGTDSARHAEADPPRPPESDPAAAELRDRMERLPPGHPSSPYRGDGSRKPSPPDLSAHELPIPGDPDYRPDTGTSDAGRLSDGSPAEAHDSKYAGDTAGTDEEPTTDSGADRSLDTEETSRTGPDGSWEWKGYPLTAEQSRAADHRVEKCQEAEGRDTDGSYGERGITPAMRRIEAQLEWGELVPDTEKFALKTTDRFKEKLAKMIIEEPDADLSELIPRIADGVRYTFSFPDEEYSSGVMEAREALTTAGFELYEQKNAWADETKSYKGINSTWMDHNSGVLFEVQMHTATSWSAKQESHHEYEIIESGTATADEKALARQRQDQIFARVPIPDGAAEIPIYRKEGW